MAQTDILTYNPIILWIFITTIISFLWLNTNQLPVFINKIKKKSKITNILFFKNYIILYKIKILETLQVIKMISKNTPKYT